MSVLQALILGIVQGLTEFLPISSSGHLTLVPFIIGWPEPTLAFDVAVHLGTLLAVLWYFRDDLRNVVRAVFDWRNAPEQERALIRFLAIGTVPAVIVGLLFQSAVESAFQRPVLVSFLLGVTGYLLLSTETRIANREHERGSHEMNDVDAGTIGIAQASAILPGISRSGSTIAIGMRRGLSRTAAARFSFLLAIPALLGATVLKFPDMVSQGLAGNAPAFLVGIAASAASGLWAITWFIRMLGRRDLRPFGVYLILAMVAGLLTALARG